MHYSAITLFLAALFSVSCSSEDADLYGAWRPVIYNIQGTEHSMDGLMIITSGFFSSNTVFKPSATLPANANANAGPYKLVDNKIVLNQWMQLHWRPTDEQENFLAQDVVEEIPYTIEKNRLIFFFPSGNKYIAEKLSD